MKMTIHVEGMTCSACERRIEKTLLAVPGVASAKASQVRGRVEVVLGNIGPGGTGSGSDGAPGLPELRSAIEGCGYPTREGPSRATPIALGIGILLAAAYLLASDAGLFNDFPMADSTISSAMLVVIGLLTSVHCVAMCGGLSLSQSLRTGAAVSLEGRRAAFSFERFEPGLLYNAGRVVSYTLVGALIGGLGSVLSFDEAAKGGITALAGLFMLWLGLRMIGALPALPRLSRHLPAPLAALVTRLRSLTGGRGPFVVGLLGGLMPCGPLQTMQLYALGTGSALAGAFSMLLFSLGTVPLMLVFGAAAALLPRKVMPIMIKASSILVLLLGVLTLGRAAALAGIALPTPLADRPAAAEVLVASTTPLRADDRVGRAEALAIPASFSTRAAPHTLAINSYSGSTTSDPVGTTVAGSAVPPVQAVIKDGVQTVVTTFSSRAYAPFIVQAGIPVRWIIKIRKEDITGCNRTLIIPAYRIRYDLRPGDNLIEFTPKNAGIVPYSCWMGMIRSSFSIVPELGKANSSYDGGSSSSTLPQALVLATSRRHQA